MARFRLPVVSTLLTFLDRPCGLFHLLEGARSDSCLTKSIVSPPFGMYRCLPERSAKVEIGHRESGEMTAEIFDIARH